MPSVEGQNRFKVAFQGQKEMQVNENKQNRLSGARKQRSSGVKPAAYRTLVNMHGEWILWGERGSRETGNTNATSNSRLFSGLLKVSQLNRGRRLNAFTHTELSLTQFI